MTGKSRCGWVIFICILCLSCQQEQEKIPAKPTTPASPVNNKESTITVNVDKSPLDMSYYPDEYPQLKMSGKAKEPIIARVIYSRPKKEGRVIFGDVVKYGSRWRLGANEASEIEFFKDVTIQNTLVKKNRYIIYCVPHETKWTIILNNDLFAWGLKIDSSKDAYKFDIPVTKTHYPMEYFTMGFEKKDTGINLVMSWDTIKSMLPISY